MQKWESFGGVPGGKRLRGIRGEEGRGGCRQTASMKEWHDNVQCLLRLKDVHEVDNPRMPHHLEDSNLCAQRLLVQDTVVLGYNLDGTHRPTLLVDALADRRETPRA